ncbi:MAG: DUF4175 family protein [Bacteroidota bacterium]
MARVQGTEPAHMELNQSSRILEDLLKRLREVRSKQLKADGFANALLFGSGILASGAVFALFEILSQSRSSVRTGLVALYGAILFVLLLLFIARPLLRLLGILPSASDEETARHVGDRFPEIRDKLLNALQLAQRYSANTALYSGELIDASLEGFAQIIRPLDFTNSVDRSQVARSGKWFTLVGVSCVWLWIAFPSSLPNSLYRMLHYGREFIPPPQFVFEVTPGNKEVVKDENVEITVKAIPTVQVIAMPEVQLLRRVTGQESFEETALRPDSSGLFHGVFSNIRASTEYFAQSSGVESDRYKLLVLDRPVIRSLRVRLEYPSYTKLPSRIQDEFVGDITALAGTRVKVAGASNKSLRNGTIVMGDSPALPLTIRGEEFSASFPVTRDQLYSVSVTDEEKLSNLNPIQYRIKIIPDEVPTVAIEEPGRNIDLAGDQSLNLRIHAADDFGFTRLQLGYRLAKSRYEEGAKTYTYTQISLRGTNQQELQILYPWDLSKLHLVPEDVVEYFAEVYDNDVVKGPKSARSAVYLIRLPSLEEVFSDLDKGHEQSLNELSEALEKAKKLKEDVELINQDLKKNKDIDWQKQKKMEEIKKQYDDVQKNLENVQAKLDQMTQQMQQQNVLSKETMEKYLELQQLFEQINSTELQQALKQMQQSMQNVSKEQLQQALQKMTFSEERFRESIERTLNLLKRIQIEQKLDEVKKRAQELEKLQKDLKEDNSGDAQKQQEAASKQEDLAKKESEMEKESAGLQQRMEEFFTEMPADKLQKLNEQLQQQQLSKTMSQAAQQMKQGQRQQAQQLQSQAGQQLQQFSEQLDALQQEMLQQQMQHIMNEMRKATGNLLELSKREEELKQQSLDAPPNSSQLRQNAQDQQRVMQDLDNVVDGLSELSKKSFVVTPGMGKALGEALARMQNAMRGLDVRSGTMASQEQGAAMASLNRAAMQVQQALQAMMQQGQGGGMGGLMQQLQMMAGQQMSLNTQTQQMGQGMSEQQAAEAARLSVEQEAIRKSVDQLNKEAQASGEQQRMLGDLQKIAEEMKEVVQNLAQNNVSPETVRKQERILSRLLDASKSVRERDFEKKRKAQTGTQIARKSPGEINPNALDRRNRLRDDLLKALEQKYSKDYQELIRKYFEELEKLEKVGQKTEE